MKALFCFLLFMFSCLSQAQYESLSFPKRKIKSISIKNISGKISIYASNAPELVVEFEKVRFPSHCELNVSKGLEELKVEISLKKNAENRMNEDKESCLVNFRVRAPKQMNLDVKNGFGPLDILGIEGKLNYLVGSGDIQVDGHFENLVGKVGSGNQKIGGRVTNANLEAGRGTFKLNLQELPVGGELSLKNGMGDAQILLPESASFRTLFESGIGKLFNEFSNSGEQSSFLIKMQSGTGALRVKKN